MDQTLDSIKVRIPEFAGYGDEISRRLADEQIRALVGEALALLNERHADYFIGEAMTSYDALIRRCEFVNQSVFRFIEYAALSDDRKVALAHVDYALVEKAALAPEVTAESLAAYLRDLEAAFETRDGAITEAV
ncbi:MAG: hypothetical protein JO024_02185 [Candidatus Eremiobacteraeota bacterium]|nr:hypothetical protein [Candidatus Eremiobacteraeota bacterium]MBV9737061.1 hypothetical protein [Candidatus Eremiobacteraeota bacterium]